VHIPDGYLSPSTCAALYAGAVPFWWASLGRLRRTLHTRLVPRLSLFAAFSFVVMMFNIPLPGGTTGHATGVGLAAVVLGPAASILAVSTALTIQAFFFGDGGITALGANCFNMAIVGSLCAFAVYRVVAWGAPLDSPRRIAAAGLAGYVAINAAALVTAVEFGVQPMFFRDATGAPLYCPYPLSIAVPAMMIGHLTVAGIAEMFLTAGVVGFLLRTDPSMLAAAAGTASATGEARVGLRALWGLLGVMLVLTPLGLLAAGTAWGEWSAKDFESSTTRQSIATASRQQAPPAAAPKGLARLGTIWSAPLPDYAPPVLKSEVLGYALSGMLGAGLVVLAAAALSALARPRTRSVRPRGGLDA
jgi:cobalt/nickel transport system permease protein